MEATKCEYKNRHLNDPVHLSSQENINRIGVREECGGMEWETFKLIRARRVCYEDECPWMGPINEIHVKVERAFSIELQNFVASWGLRPKDTLVMVGAKPITADCWGAKKVTNPPRRWTRFARTGLINKKAIFDLADCWVAKKVTNPPRRWTRFART
ncbi:hypothetical protein LguiA_013072 [Lonicera macranthoides]